MNRYKSQISHLQAMIFWEVPSVTCACIFLWDCVANNSSSLQGLWCGGVASGCKWSSARQVRCWQRLVSPFREVTSYKDTGYRRTVLCQLLYPFIVSMNRTPVNCLVVFRQILTNIFKNLVFYLLLYSLKGSLKDDTEDGKMLGVIWHLQANLFSCVFASF